MTQKIGIINYGLGNLASVANAFEYIGIDAEILTCPSVIKDMDKIILPGVGAFGRAMDNMVQQGWIHEINEHVISQEKPILGICLGMQLLATQSEEYGIHNGLNLIPGMVKKFDSTSDIRIPHVGWNSVTHRNQAKTYENIDMPDDFYFVHSYIYHPDNEEHISGITAHGIEFVASVEKDHVWGAQFHPEKSHKAGLQLLQNFGAF